MIQLNVFIFILSHWIFLYDSNMISTSYICQLWGLVECFSKIVRICQKKAAMHLSRKIEKNRKVCF